MPKKALLKKLSKSLFLSGLGLVGLVLLTGVGAGAIAQKQKAKTHAAANDFLQQYPKTQKNASAATLESLVADLGLVLTDDPNDATAPEPNPEKAADFETISQVLIDYFEAQEAAGDSSRIPETLQTYLTDNQAAIEAIQAHLRSQPQPVWDFDAVLFTDFENRRPNYTGLRSLHKLLLLKATRHSKANQIEDMVATIEAAQVLSRSLSVNPEFVSYFVSLALSSAEAFTLRHLSRVPPELTAELLAAGQGQRSLEALRFDAWTMYKAMDNALEKSAQDEFLLPDGTSPTAVILLRLPFQEAYLTLSTVNIVHTLNGVYEQLADVNLCEVSQLSSPNESVAWWNILGQVSVPNFVGQWVKSGKQTLHAELTHRIVQAKFQAAKQGQWPETLSDLNSQVCPQETWVYEVNSNGKMSLSFSHDFEKLGLNINGAPSNAKLTY